VRVASGLSRVWSRTAAKLAGAERACAANAAASNFPGPVGSGSEMVRVLNKMLLRRGWSAPVCFYHTAVIAGSTGVPPPGGILA
jgi:hypothetical protein